MTSPAHSDSPKVSIEAAPGNGVEVALTPQAERGLSQLAGVLKKPNPISVVLLIDDDQVDTELAMRAIQIVDDTIRVEIVDDGLKAIDYLEGNRGYSDRTRFPLPQIVLLDLGLPNVSGIDVLKHIRSHPQLKASSVVTLTGSDDNESAEEISRLGVSAHLKKSNSYEDLVEIIRSLRASGLI